MEREDLRQRLAAALAAASRAEEKEQLASTEVQAAKTQAVAYETALAQDREEHARLLKDYRDKLRRHMREVGDVIAKSTGGDESIRKYVDIMLQDLSATYAYM